MTTFKLKDTNVFPSTKLYSINKLITENSLTRLINRLIDCDGFVITDGLRHQVGHQFNFDEDIPVSEFETDTPFEFVLRGYYFKVDKVTSLISQVPSSELEDNTSIWARIIIDKTNPDYPELAGQNSMTPVSKMLESFVSGTTSIQIEQGTIIKDPALFDSEGSVISQPDAVMVDEVSGIITCTGYITDKSANDVKGIRYIEVTTYNGVEFYVGQPQSISSSTPPPVENNSSEQNATDIYEMELLRYFKPDSSATIGWYVPMDSLYKFNSYSLEKIDGGELSYQD